jgi:hypothetical protein
MCEQLAPDGKIRGIPDRSDLAQVLKQLNERC